MANTREYIGGRKLGRVASIVYEYGLDERRERGLGESEEATALSRLVSAIGGVCATVQAVSRGRFDRRRNDAAAKSAAFAQRMAPRGVFEL